MRAPQMRVRDWSVVNKIIIVNDLPNFSGFSLHLIRTLLLPIFHRACFKAENESGMEMETNNWLRHSHHHHHHDHHIVLYHYTND